MGGAWFDEYLKNKSSDEILSLALSEIRKHLDLKVEPDYQEISILKVKIILMNLRKKNFLFKLFFRKRSLSTELVICNSWIKLRVNLKSMT